jgi:hypothetical protein
MIKLDPGTHIIVLNKVGGKYQIETDLTSHILELQRYTSIALPRRLTANIPDSATGPQKLFAYITVCFGCQTCWRMDDDKISDTGPHYIGARDITEFVRKVYDAPIVALGTFCNTDAVAEHFATAYQVMNEVFGDHV